MALRTLSRHDLDTDNVDRWADPDDSTVGEVRSFVDGVVCLDKRSSGNSDKLFTWDGTRRSAVALSDRTQWNRRYDVI